MTQQPGWTSPEEPGPGVPSGGWGGPPPAYPTAGQGPGQAPGGAWGAGPGTPWQTAPRPGIVPLRPLSIGEIYDGAFQAIRTNPRTMVGFAAIVMAVTTLIGLVPQAAALTALGGSDLNDPERIETMTATDVINSLSGTLSATLIPAFIQTIALFVVTGLLIVAVSEAVIGRRTSPGELWGRTKGRLPRLIGLLIVEGVLITLGFLLLLVPGLLLLLVNTVAGVAVMVIGGVAGLLLVLALYLSLWSVAAPALLLEDLGVFAALRRSRKLAGRSFWRVLGIMLLSTILVTFGQGLVSLPFTVASVVVTAVAGADDGSLSFGANLLSLGFTGVGSIIGAAIFYPFSAAVTALLYVDLRMRHEGLDVELARASGVQ